MIDTKQSETPEFDKTSFAEDEMSSQKEVKLLKDSLAIVDVMKMLKDENVRAVDLKKFNLSPKSVIVKEVLKHREDLELIDNDIRKVDRNEVYQRMIAKCKNAISYYSGEITLSRALLSNAQDDLKKIELEYEAYLVRQVEKNR